MSTTTKRTYEEALRDAIAFANLFNGCEMQWTFAGSLRRHKAEIGDIEHCVIPRFIDGGTGLFAEPVNAVWKRLDELVAEGKLAKHLYANGYRWGMKYRGVDFGGAMHEIFTADEANYGSVLAIRTGSADFSRELVTGLLRAGRRNKDGYVWSCKPCDCRTVGNRNDPGNCKLCDSTGLVPVAKIPVPTEEDFFDACGKAWVSPEKR